MKLSRALSDLVKYTKSVGMHDVEAEGEGRGPWGCVGGLGRCLGVPLRPASCPAVASSWQVSSFSETRAQQILQQKPAQYLRFNQHQLSRIYPSSYRVDSSNYNPQPFWNAGCQMGACGWDRDRGGPGAPGGVGGWLCRAPGASSQDARSWSCTTVSPGLAHTEERRTQGQPSRGGGGTRAGR